ncbi:MAG: NFACT family protein [Candidatus Micrarchaeota archaeon]
MADAVSAWLLKKALEEASQEIEGKKVNKIQQIGAELFRISFHPGSAKLLIEPGRRLHLTWQKKEAPEKASQISMKLRKELSNLELKSACQHENDMVFVFDFGHRRMILEHFSGGNLIVTDSEYKIIFAFRKKKWKDREIKPGVQYVFPSDKKMPAKESWAPLSGEVKSVNEALDELYAGKEGMKENKTLKGLQRRLDEQNKKLQQYRKNADQYKEIADKIYASYDKVEKELARSKSGKTVLNLD